MSAKVLALFAVLCLLGSCWGVEETTQTLTRHEDVPIEPLGVSSDPDASQDASFWRLWKFWKWGRSVIKNVFKHSSDMAESASGRHRIHQDRGEFEFEMFYVDSQRTVTRRESSLITARRRFADDRFDYFDNVSTTQGPVSSRLTSDSGAFLLNRPKGTVRKEIITLLFESMLESVVESWEVISVNKTEESLSQLEKTPSEVSRKKKPSALASKTSKHKTKSRSKLELIEGSQSDHMQIVWWSAPDEKSVILFKNGNIYEGDISGKCMHGYGRFQWNDGTVYLGEFKANEMNGKGIIQWKDDTWYEGDFVGNLRHGKGLYVDSRRQRSYTGGWHCGTKHGKGTIYYSKSFRNSYDGDWVFNVRHGFGIREYCQWSGYKGEWDRYTREGRGLMIWPNHDFYKGEWKNGVMSGNGMYIWDTAFNNSMSLPSLNAYRGQWVKGVRNGHGLLNLGLGSGSHYIGDFKNNKKDGAGKFVTNNGLILKSSKLFTDDNMMTMRDYKNDGKEEREREFTMCDSMAGLRYHVEEAFNNFDKKYEMRARIVREYIENNKVLESDFDTTTYDDQSSDVSQPLIKELIDFEVRAFWNSIKCYETKLKSIYYKYATLCNTEPINFTPVLIRLYLWQFYTDCDIHEKGLTLVQIDDMAYKNPDWLHKTPHGPFEKVYFWQFLHSLITIASYLYSKKSLPGPKPDTVLATGFRYFMDNDVLPNVGRCKGHLTQSFGLYVPLKALYKVYRTLGEPHTLRTFLCAVRRCPHLYMEEPQPELVDASDQQLPVGQNAYVFGDEMTFVPGDKTCLVEQEEYEIHESLRLFNFGNLSNKTCLVEQEEYEIHESLRLFNFGNLSSKTVINIFGRIFPHIIKIDKIIDLDIKITFYEFFEAFMACTEESIRVKEEEMRWREMLEELSATTEHIRPQNKMADKTK